MEFQSYLSSENDLGRNSKIFLFQKWLTEFQGFSHPKMVQHGIPRAFLFREMVWNGIPRIFLF
jgi:hypothetical protein